MTRRSPSLHGVPSRTVPPLHRYYENAPTPAPPSRRTSVLARRYQPPLQVLRSHRSLMHNRGPGRFGFGTPKPTRRMERNRPPRFLENPRGRSPWSTTPAGSMPLAVARHRRGPRTLERRRLPATADDFGAPYRAFVLAVYASQRSSQTHHARLASGCRLSTTGWDWLPTGFQRKVSTTHPTLPPPSPGFAWRNQGRHFCARGVGGLGGDNVHGCPLMGVNVERGC